MRLGGGFIAFAIGLALATPALAFDPAPWIADLEQTRLALHAKYANFDWVENERGVKIDALFEDLGKRMRNASDEDAAKAVFARLQRKLGDGHVEIEWPEPSPSSKSSAASTPVPDFCGGLGYDPRQNGPGTAQALSGYEPLPDGGNPIAAGMVKTGSDTLGIIRIGVFQPQGFPELCRLAVRELHVPADKPCDEKCENLIAKAAYIRLTDGIESRIRELKAAGATTILVDISNNGGGSEWAEAVARMITTKPVTSERQGFVRTEHWRKHWSEISADLKAAAKKAAPADRARLLGWASEADSAEFEARSPCRAASCARVPSAAYSTGFIGSAPAGAFAGKEWGTEVFTPAQYEYRDGVWDGPLLVLVDQETWSAAEEFAAVLQDNKAAVVIGARTGGAGCGFTDGGDPTTLKNSGAVLKLPDCVRFRADGSNEVRGIIPDELVPIRADDGVVFRASLIAPALPSAIARAKALAPQSH